jgi:cytochrome c oxidase subunit III
MPGTTTLPDIEIIVEDIGGGGVGPPPGGDNGDGGGGDGDGGERNSRRRDQPLSPKRYYTAITLGLVSILMFFMALSAAFLFRRASGTDWIPIHLPVILLFNTMVLIASSFTLELARKRLANSNILAFKRLWTLTTSFGGLFLIGQLFAWRQLVSQGVYMASNPASSFFYIFTGAHGVHLLGGVAALGFVSFRKAGQEGIPLPTAAEITSYYWHFMDGLWVFLLALLYLGR